MMGAGVLFVVLMGASALVGVGIRRLTGWCCCHDLNENQDSSLVGVPPS